METATLGIIFALIFSLLVVYFCGQCKRNESAYVLEPQIFPGHQGLLRLAEGRSSGAQLVYDDEESSLEETRSENNSTTSQESQIFCVIKIPPFSKIQYPMHSEAELEVPPPPYESTGETLATLTRA